MVGSPFRRQVQRQLREIVGDHSAGRHVDDRGDGDAFWIVRKACEIRVLQPGNLQHWVDAAGIEIESPAALVMGWPAKPNGQHAFQSKQPPDDDRAVGPRAGASDDQPVPVRLHRIAVAAVGGDPGFDVFGVAGEFAGLGDVGSYVDRQVWATVRNRRARSDSVDAPASQCAIHGPVPSDWSIIPSSSQV